MKKMRSQEWYGKFDKDGFIHRSWMKNQGLPDHVFDGRPVIGICKHTEITPQRTFGNSLIRQAGCLGKGGLPPSSLLFH